LEDVWGDEVLEDGTVVLPPLAPGTYDFEVTPNPDQPGTWKGTFFPMEVRALVEPGRECRLDLRARSGGLIRLTVHLAGDGELPRGDRLRISLMREATGEVMGRMGWDTDLASNVWTPGATPGHPGVSMDVLEAGWYVLKAAATGYRSKESRVLVRKGQIEDLELTLDRG
jgi:hypothetical protein